MPRLLGKLSALALTLVAAALASASFATVLPGGKTLRAVVYSPPETIITSKPNFWSNDPTPNFEFESNQRAAVFQCRWFDRPWFSCSSPFQGGKRDDGRHEFSVRALNAGRLDLSPATHKFYIDTTRPRTTIAGPDATFDPTPKFILDSNEEQTSFECSLNGAAWGECQSPWTRRLEPGTYTLRARATDRAGNTDATPATKQFRVRRDVTPPQTTIDGPERTKDRSPVFALEANESEVSFECSLDGAAWAPCGRRFVSPLLSLGTHRLRARATDASGNVDPTPATKQFRVIR